MIRDGAGELHGLIAAASAEASTGTPIDLTGDGVAESRGYDTTGDGKLDALDTNGDGALDARIVRAQGVAASKPPARARRTLSEEQRATDSRPVSRLPPLCIQSTE